MTRPAHDTAREVPVVHEDPVVGDVSEPEEFGLRVTWQSEEQQLEAAEFLLATRVQEQVRRRVARAAMDVRDNRRDELSTAIHERPAD